MAALSIHCPRQTRYRPSTPSPPPVATHRQRTLAQPDRPERPPLQVSLAPLRIKSQKKTSLLAETKTNNSSSSSTSSSSSHPPTPSRSLPPIPLSLLDNDQLQLLSQLVDDAMHSTTTSPLLPGCLFDSIATQTLETVTPSSFSEGYLIHSPTHTPANTTLTMLVGSTPSDYDTITKLNLDTTALISFFPEPPSEKIPSSARSSAHSLCSVSSSLSSCSLSSSHASDRDSTNSLLSTISTNSAATTMSSVSTSYTPISLSGKRDDVHNGCHDISPCSSDIVQTCAASDNKEHLSGMAEAKATSKSKLKKSASKCRRQKLSIKRHWEVPPQACVIPPIFDRRFFEDEKAEIPKSIKAIEEERRQLTTQEKEDENDTKKPMQQRQLADANMNGDAREDGADEENEKNSSSSMMKLTGVHHQQQQQEEAQPAMIKHQLPPHHPGRPLTPPLSLSSGGSTPFLDEAPSRPVSPNLPTNACVTNPVVPCSSLQLWESHRHPQEQMSTTSSRISAMETSMRAATCVLEQRAEWLNRIDKQHQQQQPEESNRPRSPSPCPPRRLGPPMRSNTSPSLLRGIPTIDPPTRTSSIRTFKSLASNKEKLPMMPQIPTWARRFDIEGEEEDGARVFGVTNGVDEITTRDSSDRRRRRHMRLNTEERHAEWMETIKAGSSTTGWHDHDDPSVGWSDKFHRLKQHFQTVTGRPGSPEESADAGQPLSRPVYASSLECSNTVSTGGKVGKSKSMRAKSSTPRPWFLTNSSSLRVNKEKTDLTLLAKRWQGARSD